MAERRERGRKNPRKYNILLVPEGESGRSHSFRVTKLGVILSLLGSLILIVSIVVVVLVYSPVGAVITIPNPHLEERYVNELMHVQDRLNRVTEDVIFMREYNLQMRRALGEDVPTADSLDMASLTERREVRRQDVSPDAPSFPDEEITGEYDPMNEFGIMGTARGPIRISPATETTFRPSMPLMLPADGYVTRRFDVNSGHVGIDIAGKVNTPIASVAAGTVIFSGWTYSDGNMVIISHGNGFFSVYKHNQSNLVRQGAVVRRGETIALLGDTGKQSFGPHLHFELWKDGVPLDPARYLFDFKDS